MQFDVNINIHKLRCKIHEIRCKVRCKIHKIRQNAASVSHRDEPTSANVFSFVSPMLKGSKQLKVTQILYVNESGFGVLYC